MYIIYKTNAVIDHDSTVVIYSDSCVGVYRYDVWTRGNGPSIINNNLTYEDRIGSPDKIWLNHIYQSNKC